VCEPFLFEKTGGIAPTDYIFIDSKVLQGHDTLRNKKGQEKNHVYYRAVTIHEAIAPF
jgi:hypothetical protein